MHSFYSKMYSKGFSKTEIAKAGFFHHNEPKELCNTSLDSTIENTINDLVYRSQSKDINVIILTGCFNPLHSGHIFNLVSAKEYVKTLNNNPTLCILCPAHDSYSTTKVNNKDDIYSRINQMKEFTETILDTCLKNHINITIDSFPAIQYESDINFTYIIERYQTILNSLGVTGKIFFSYGSDNAEFGYVLAANNINGICIIRNDDKQKMENVIRCLNKKKLNTSLIHNIFDNTFSEVNSTSLRNTNRLYLIRNDLEYALPNTPKDELMYYATTITRAFQKAFINTDIQVKTININSQMKFIQKPDNAVIISLDKFFKGDFNVDISRVFSINSYQKTALKNKIFNENEFIEFIIECDNRGIQKYIIVDDDKSTGQTTSFIENILDRFAMKFYDIEFKYLNELWLDDNHLDKYNVYDIVDMRDFVLKSLHGGLMCEIAGTTKRFMYYSPEVNLATRAKLPPHTIKEFTETMIHMNKGRIYD